MVRVTKGQSSTKLGQSLVANTTRIIVVVTASIVAKAGAVTKVIFNTSTTIFLE